MLLNWEFGTLFGYGDAWGMAYGLGTNYSNLNSAGINAYKNIEGRDIEREVIGTAYSQNHNITISGGSKKAKYSVSLDNLDDDGLKILSWYKRTNVLTKINSELAKGLVFDLEASYSDQDVVGNESQSNTIGSKLTGAMSFTPVTPLGDISGNNTQLGMYETYVRKAYDPINIINDIYDKTNRQRTKSKCCSFLGNH